MTNRNAFEKYNINIPKKNIYEFEDEDIIKILTFKVGTEVPRVLKDLDVYINKNKQFSAKKTSLLFNGKKDKRPNYRMKNYVEEYVDFFNDVEINLKQALSDILEEVISDMANYNKDFNRKQLFINTVDTLTGQTFLFIIGVISLGEYLIKKFDYIENGRYLEQVLKAKRDLANKIKQIFKDMNRGIYSREEANELFKNLINQRVQDISKIDMETYNAIKFENDLYIMCDEESITNIIYEIVENARIDVTSQKRLIELTE